MFTSLLVLSKHAWSFPEKTQQLDFYVEVIADMTVITIRFFFVESYAESFHSPTQKSLKRT